MSAPRGEMRWEARLRVWRERFHCSMRPTCSIVVSHGTCENTNARERKTGLYQLVGVVVVVMVV